MMKIMRFARAFLSAFCSLLMLTQAFWAAKTDIVVLLNGDAVSGEVKSLEFGELRHGEGMKVDIGVYDWRRTITQEIDLLQGAFCLNERFDDVG